MIKKINQVICGNVSKKTLKEYWTFRHQSNKKFTHGLHKYPARMHPEIAKKIIEDYADKKTVIIDNYVGSGGTVTEGMLNGINSIGFDINPFAILLAKVKTTVINEKAAEQEYLRIIERSKRDYQKGRFYPKLVPNDYDVEYWNKPSVIKKLSILKHYILKSKKNYKIKNFLKICFSQTTRLASNERKDEFKHWRMPEDELRTFRPNVFEIFSKVCQKNCSLMADFKVTMRGKKSKVIVKYGNAKKLSESLGKKEKKILKNAKKHLVITSPPYGDSGTTVAYGQFSLHPGLWLDLPTKRMKEVDKICLGGQRYKESRIELGSKRLNSRLREISKLDIKRADQVYAFFYDFDQSLAELAKILKKGSHLCFVIANRTVKRIPIQTDKILIDLCKKYHFKHIVTYPRYIPIKLMPRKNAPENLKKNSGKTMIEEKIVIFRN